MPGRPNLPRALVRSVKVEAGHRCAIPTCLQHPVEIAHIERRNLDGSNDVFENLIALCPTCHTRYDNDEIDRLAMLQYKANLSVLNHRYGELERRVLQAFADMPAPRTGLLEVPGGMGLLLQFLYRDGLVRNVPTSELGLSHVELMGVPSLDYLGLTDTGHEFLEHWLRAQDLEGE